MHPVFFRNLTELRFLCESTKKSKVTTLKKDEEKKRRKKPKNPQWRRQGDVILINFLRPPNPTQGQPANLPGCHHWFQSTVQALRVCSTFYQVFLLFLLYSLKPAAHFYTRAIESNISFFYFVVLQWTLSCLQPFQGTLSQKLYFFLITKGIISNILRFSCGSRSIKWW